MRTLVSTLLLVLAACGGRDAPVDAAATDRAVAEPPAGPHTVVVWATRSLQAPMQQLAKRYEERSPGATVNVFCAGGAELLAKRNTNERCDVIAIGDASLMSRFAASAYLATGTVAELARNRLAIAVPAGNPKQVQSLADFARPDLRIAMGKRSSSIGRWSRWALTHANVEPKPAVECDTADAVATAVQDGKADAGIVYVTTFAGDRAQLARVDVPGAANQPVLYSIAVDSAATEPRGAAAFRAFALSADGQAVFRNCGFRPIGDK